MMKHLIDRLDEWLRNNRSDYYMTLQPGASSTEIETIEAEIRIALPDDFKSFYQWRNGQRSSSSIEPRETDFYLGWQLYSTSEMLAAIQEMNSLADGGPFNEENWWNQSWVPYLGSTSSENICIDMAGSFGGEKGQIIQFLPHNGEREILHANFSKWLETVVASYTEGFVCRDEHGWFKRDDYETFYQRINSGYPKVHYAR